MRDSDARRKACENAVCESRLHIRLEDHTRNPVHHGEKHHRA